MNLTPQQIKDKLIFPKKTDDLPEPVKDQMRLRGLEIKQITTSQEDIIKGYINYLYTSDEAKAIFNKITKPISIIPTSSLFGGKDFGTEENPLEYPVVFFDIDLFDREKYGYISKTGEFVGYDVRLSFMHELIHAITGILDQEQSPTVYSSSENSLGPTQVIANKIHDELGHPIRVSYDGATSLREKGEAESIGNFERGTQFTKDKIVDTPNVEINIAAFVSNEMLKNYSLPNGLIGTNSQGQKTNDLFIHGQSRKETTSNIAMQTGAGNDYLYGNDGNDTLIAGVDNDYLNGGKGNDELRGDDYGGGMGKDTAEFSDIFENYDVKTTGTTSKTTTITHKNNGVDGTDTVYDIEWGTFKGSTQPLGNARLATDPAPRIIPLPLEDGVPDTETVKATDNTLNPNSNDLPTPPYVSLTAPVAMLDGNVDYTLNISPYKPNTLYNISYIFDTSASMDATELQQAKNAYTDLTNYFIDNELAENINFSVISFSRNANLSANLTASQAISTIQGLSASTNPIEGTKYNDALYKGLQFFTQSPLKGTTNISYFVSDGKSQHNLADLSDVSYVYDAVNLRKVSNVQSFGIYDSSNVASAVTPNQINFVDSNNGVLVNSAAELSPELLKSGLAGTVTEVKILVDGAVVDTIPANKLVDSPLGLTYKGSVYKDSIDKLDVSVNAKNVITAEVVFDNNTTITANTSANFTVTAGSGKLTDASGNPLVEPPVGNDEDPFERIRNGGDDNDDITLGYVDQGASGGLGNDYIVGNKRDNQLDGGDGNDTIIGHEGNDTITTGAGTNKVTGGAGIDTVLYGNVAYPGSTSLRQAASSVLYNNTDTLTEVEYLQFSDVRISAKTLKVVPILNAADVSITEGDSGTKTAQVTFNLSNPAPGTVTFNYSTADLDAVAGSDYVAQSGQVIIPAGQTSASVDFTINDDTTYEANETFGLTLSGISGATFKDNVTEYNATVTIANDDPINYAPFSSGIPNTIATANAPNQSINLAQAFQDLEDTNLTYSVQNNTNSTLFDAVTVDQANKTLLLDYKASTTGNSALTVRATDSKGLFVDTSLVVLKM